MLKYDKLQSITDIPQSSPLVTHFGPWNTNDSPQFKCFLNQDLRNQEKQHFLTVKKKSKNKKISQRQVIKRKISVASCSANYQSKSHFLTAESNWSRINQEIYKNRPEGMSLQVRRNWFPPLISQKRVNTQIIHQRFFSAMKDIENSRSRRIIMFREQGILRSESRTKNNKKLIQVNSKKHRLKLVPIQVKFFQNS